MSGTKGIMHYRVEIKQEAVRLVLEEHRTYVEVATNLRFANPNGSKSGSASIGEKESHPFISQSDGLSNLKQSRENWSACAWRMPY